MNRSEWLTDDLIQAALEQRAGRAAPGDLRDLVIARTGVARQRAAWRFQARHLLSAPAMRPAWVAMFVLAALLGLAVAAATVGQHQAPKPVPTQFRAGPFPSSLLSASPSPSGLTRPSGVIAFSHFGGHFEAGGISPDKNETSRLWVVNSDGSGAHELFPGRPGQQGGVAWSPDGRRLIFWEGPRESTGEFVQRSTNLYMSDASGTDPQIVDTSCERPCYDDNDPAFSSDGRQLVFSRVIATDTSSPPPVSVIATMDLASGRVEELNSTKLTISKDGWDSHPRYSPDGTQIVFARTGIGPFASGAVFVVEVDGENLRQLSPATVNVRDPEWSPDRSRIVFYGRPRIGGTDSSSVQSNVYVVRPDGTDLRQLTSDNVSMGASWTDDGRILFVRIPIVNGIESADFWLMDADGQNQLPLTLAGEAGQCCPVGAAWQPIP